MNLHFLSLVFVFVNVFCNHAYHISLPLRYFVCFAQITFFLQHKQISVEDVNLQVNLNSNCIWGYLKTEKS